MKSYLQLARAAYEAGQKSMQEQKLPTAGVLPWAALPAASKNVWVAVARCVVAEMASVQ
ncbi:MAG: hypothetical protein ACT4NV_18045 [Rhodoferax sp.]